MRRLIAILTLLALSLAPTPAFAHDTVEMGWEQKSDGASPEIACVAVGEFQGHRRERHFKMQGDPSQPVDSERRWLSSFCEDEGRFLIKSYFLYTEKLEIPDSAIKITSKQMP